MQYIYKTYLKIFVLLFFFQCINNNNNKRMDQNIIKTDKEGINSYKENLKNKENKKKLQNDEFKKNYLYNSKTNKKTKTYKSKENNLSNPKIKEKGLTKEKTIKKESRYKTKISRPIKLVFVILALIECFYLLYQYIKNYSDDEIYYYKIKENNNNTISKNFAIDIPYEKNINNSHNNLLIFSICTIAAKDFIKNWLTSINKNNFQNNFFIIAIDQDTYDFLNDYIPKKINFTKKLDHNYTYFYDLKIQKKTNKSYINFGSDKFKEIACIRPKIINLLMQDFSKNEKLKYHRLLYVDIDTIFLKSFQAYNKLLSNTSIYSKYEIVFGDDTNIIDKKFRYICSCLIYFPLNIFNNYSIAINRNTNKFLDKWNRNCFKRKSNGNQVSLNKLLNKNILPINYTIFNQLIFPNGLTFRTWISPKDFIYKNKSTFLNMYWMHANYHIGKEEKIDFFKKYNQWFIY